MNAARQLFFMVMQRAFVVASENIKKRKVMQPKFCPRPARIKKAIANGAIAFH
jgi:hypothetical protein